MLQTRDQVLCWYYNNNIIVRKRFQMSAMVIRRDVLFYSLITCLFSERVDINKLKITPFQAHY